MYTFNDEVDINVEILTAKPTETRADLCRLLPIDDRDIKRERAHSLLQRLAKHEASLLESLDFNDVLTNEILLTFEECDNQKLADLGIDTGYAWIDDIVAAMINGAPFVEIETVGPYAYHHLDGAGRLKVSYQALPPDEKTGILLARLLRELSRDLNNVRLVSLFDDLNDSNDLPTPRLTTTQQKRFIIAMSELLYEHKVLLPGDRPGKDYLILRESNYIPTVDRLIEQLKQTDSGIVKTLQNNDVIFYPSDSLISKLALDSNNRRQEFRKRGITLKKEGRPTCHAFDAASFLDNPINKDIIHFVILGSHFKNQQDKTYALLRALDIVVQEGHHNIFFDTDRLTPELITYGFCKLLTRQIEDFLRITELMDSWNQFDPDEYATRNYGNKIFVEDKQIISFVTEQLKKSSTPHLSVKLAADIGTGPNFYPAMLLAPYVAPEGSVDLVEYGVANQAYLQSIVLQSSNQRENGPWGKFEELIVELGGEEYVGSLHKVCSLVNVIHGSIFSLPKKRYGIVTSYFVSESITSSRREFRLAIRAIASCLKQNGLLIIAHMVGSTGWHAGSGTHFPAVNLTVADIEEAYRDADLSFVLHAVGENASDKPRPGYEGMAIVVARHAKSLAGETRNARSSGTHPPQR